MTSIDSTASLRPERYEYQLPATIFYGPGSVAGLSETVEGSNVERVHLVTTRSLLATPTLKRVLDRLPDASRISLFSAHVPLQEVVEVALAIRTSDAELVVAVGGGSVIDGAKLASLVASASGLETGGVDLARELLANPHVAPHAVVCPVVCVPTTLGGAELGPGGGFTDDRTGDKSGSYHPSMLPHTVVYDPEIAESTPPALWLSTGVRALDHAFELLVAPHADPLAIALAESAVVDLFDVLPKYRRDPRDVEVRLRCQLAAWKAYTSPALASSGVSHQLSRAVGSSNGIAHGITSCVILPQALGYHEADPLTASRLAGVRRGLGIREEEGPVLSGAVEELVEELALPTRFRYDQLDDANALDAARRTAAATGMSEEAVIEILKRCRA